MMQRSRKSKGNAKRVQDRDPAATTMHQMVMVERQARTFSRVLVTSALILTNASGVIGVQNIASSTNVTSAANWGNFQGIALEFRVTGLEVDILPIVNSQTSGTTPAPSMVAVCAYSSDGIPTAFNDVAQGPGAKIYSGYRPIRFTASSKGYPNAQLWNVITGGVTPSDNIFGIVMADPGTSPFSTPSAGYFRIVVKYLVQFRSLV
jgi:hypothetical protein